MTRAVFRSLALSSFVRRSLSAQPVTTLALITLLSSPLTLSGCLSTTPTPWELDEVGGPAISYDPLHTPFPVAPSPNDSATRPDPSSPTGRRLNLSVIVNTAHTREVRRALNDLDGFGVFSPITLPLEGPLDLSTAHSGSVLLVNVSAESPRYGELVPLDLGDEPGEIGGYFPLTTPLESLYGPRPEPLSPTLLFPSDNLADVNNDGELEEVRHYEVATHTLIARPLKPLAHGATYAVLITKELSGWANELSDEYGPVRSPFPGVAALSQRALVLKGAELAKLPADELAFGWTFTTGDPTHDLREMRAGLYGEGRLASIEALSPPRFKELRDTSILHDDPENPRDTPFILKADFFTEFTSLVANIMGNSGYAIEFPDVDYFVFGSFESPQLRELQQLDPLKPAWRVGPQGLYEEPTTRDVPFFLSVPKPSEGSAPPFPVVIYFHGTNSSRMEGILLAQELARQGIALLAFDQVGHGPMIANIDKLDELRPDLGPVLSALPVLLARMFAPDLVPELTGLGYKEGMEKLSAIGLYRELAIIGRGEDVNQDNFRGDAEGFFAADPLTLCGAFWQDTLDAMQLVKLLRALSPSLVPAYLNNPRDADPERLKAHLLAGDFNADGVLDIGGPHTQISTAGTSLGGIHALLVAAAEPEIQVATPIVPGGGLVNILMRTDLRFVAGPLFLEYLGQAVVGCQREEGLYLTLGDDARRCEASSETQAERGFAMLEGSWAGRAARLINERTHEERVVEIGETGFSVQLATDRGDPITLLIEGEGGEALERFELEARVHGAGYAPRTSDFRVASGALQHMLDRCDPLSFAERVTDPLPQDGPPTKVLMLAALGDDAVPISSSIHLANALKLLGREEREWRPRLDVLRDRNVLLGAPWEPALDPALLVPDEETGELPELKVPLYDVEDVLNDNPEAAPPIGPFPPIEVGDGYSALRLADVEGKHEWVAGYERDGFNYARRSLRQIAAFHRCGGRLVLDEDPECMQSEDCTLFNTLYLRQECLLEPSATTGD